MTRVYSIFLGLIAVLLLVIWGLVGHQKARQATNETRVVQTQLDGTRVALRASKEAADKAALVAERRLAVAQKQLKEAQAAQRKLNDALKANPDWADAPVPASVWDALASSAGGSPATSPKPGPAGGLPSP